MAAAYTWPASLPQIPLDDGFDEQDGVNVISTPPDRGPAQTLLIGSSGGIISAAFFMSGAQLSALDTWLSGTVRYVRPFNWRHPRTGAAIEVKALPIGERSFRAIAPLGGGYWRVTLRLQVLP